MLGRARGCGGLPTGASPPVLPKSRWKISTYALLHCSLHGVANSEPEEGADRWFKQFNINAMSGSWKSLLCGDNDESQHLEQSPEHSRAGLSSQVLSLVRKEDFLSSSCPNACLTPEIGPVP